MSRWKCTRARRVLAALLKRGWKINSLHHSNAGFGGHSIGRISSMRAKMYDATTFLNVDLDISSRENLASLAEALRPRLDALHVGRIRRRYWARFELRTQPSTPDGAIRRLVAAIKRLPPRQRAYWNRATVRDFNIGIQAADEPQRIEFAVKPETAMMVGRLGGRIVITVYGAALTRAGA